MLMLQISWQEDDLALAKALQDQERAFLHLGDLEPDEFGQVSLVCFLASS